MLIFQDKNDKIFNFGGQMVSFNDEITPINGVCVLSQFQGIFQGQIPNFFPRNSEIGVSPYLDDDLTLPGNDRARDWAIGQSRSRSSYRGD